MDLPYSPADERRRMEEYRKICSLENLYRAHCRARLGKGMKDGQICFELNLAENLNRIHNELQSKSYRIQGYRKFIIYDPKEREIQALSYRDRVVQHSLCDNVLSDVIEKRLIYDNCACRV